MRKATLFALLFTLTAAACADGGGTGPISGIGSGFDPNRLTFASRLVPFDACDAVLAHFKAEALERVGPYGLNGGGGFFPEPRIFAAEDSAAEGAPATTTVGAIAVGDSDPSFSGTNVQVAGVDEPDIVKTDGRRIISIVDGKLRYVDVSGSNPELRGELTLESGWNHRFFVVGDRAFVFTQGDIWAIPLFAEDAARIAPGGWGMPVSVIQEIDLGDPDDPRIVRTVRLDGTYLSARAIGDTAQVVVSSFPSSLPFVYPSNQNAEDIALEANRRIIQESTIETWLPGYTTYDADGDVVDSGLLVDCGRMYRPEEFAGFDTLSVTSLDMGGSLGVGDGTGLIAQGQTVYASMSSLYVATNVWVPGDAFERFPGEMEELEDRYESAIHKFDISEGNADYRASGSIEGHLLNQFSMDEYEGYLRVATTSGSPWGSDESESQVVVLSEEDGVLEQVGSVGDMGRGERIYSVRFIGDTGYVVTFRQVDPLYVLDLRNPASPTISGELKIPGYSAYLHPLGEGMLLGVGREADSEGRVTGAKASLFDVSDPTDPRELSTWTMRSGSTEVEWDHLAFLYWEPEDIAVLPMSAWEDRFFGAVVLKTDDGLRDFGRVTHHREIGDSPTSDCEPLEFDEGRVEPGTVVQLCGEDDKGGYAGNYCEEIPFEEAEAWVAEEYGVDLAGAEPGDRIEICWPEYENQDPQIMRSLVIGDTLWTLSWRALQSNDLADLDVGTTIWFG